MKLDLKAEILRELSLESSTQQLDIGLRLGADPFHPTFRGKAVVSFACLDPLGLGTSPELITAFVKGANELGITPHAPRLGGGTTAAISLAEDRIARFFGGETATVFSTRNQCALTAITAICGEGVLVCGPTLSPLPLADACALVGAEYAEFEGEAQLKGILQRYSLAKRIVVVVEAASIITGEINQLPQLLTGIEQAGGWLFIDESGGFGWSGMRGAGTADTLVTSPALAGRFVSFTLLGGCEVAAMSCGRELRDLMFLRSRYLRSDVPPPLATLRYLTAGLDTVEIGISLREKLATRVVSTRGALHAQGWKVDAESLSPILSVWFESMQQARLVQEALLQRGLYLEVLSARGIRRNGAVLRAILSTKHTAEDVESLLAGFDEVWKRTARNSPNPSQLG